MRYRRWTPSAACKGEVILSRSMFSRHAQSGSSRHKLAARWVTVPRATKHLGPRLPRGERRAPIKHWLLCNMSRRDTYRATCGKIPRLVAHALSPEDRTCDSESTNARKEMPNLPRFRLGVGRNSEASLQGEPTPGKHSLFVG